MRLHKITVVFHDARQLIGRFLIEQYFHLTLFAQFMRGAHLLGNFTLLLFFGLLQLAALIFELIQFVVLLFEFFVDLIGFLLEFVNFLFRFLQIFLQAGACPLHLLQLFLQCFYLFLQLGHFGFFIGITAGGKHQHSAPQAVECESFGEYKKSTHGSHINRGEK